MLPKFPSYWLVFPLHNWELPGWNFVLAIGCLDKFFLIFLTPFREMLE